MTAGIVVPAPGLIAYAAGTCAPWLTKELVHHVDVVDLRIEHRAARDLGIAKPRCLLWTV